MLQVRFWMILGTWGMTLFAADLASASSYSGYDCNALRTNSGWNCPCGCASPTPSPPVSCSANSTSTNSSSVGGPHNECKITTTTVTTTYNCPPSFYPDGYSVNETYQCNLTASQCNSGEVFLPSVCGCIPNAPSCVVPGSSPPPVTLDNTGEGGSDSGCERRWKTITQKIYPGFIPGDTYSYMSAQVVATSSDTPSTIASKMASAINAISSKLGVWYSVGFSAVSSMDTITIKEPWQVTDQVNVSRPHPTCTPTPTPPTTMGTATPAPSSAPIPATPIPPTPTATPSITCTGAFTSSTSPCSCNENATGTTVGNTISCQCNSGFYLSGTSCVQDSCVGPGASLDGNGQCACSGTNVNSTPTGTMPNRSCVCNSGYYDDGAGQCAIDTCTGVGAILNGNGQCTCPLNATLSGTGTTKSCSCDAGFKVDVTGSACVAALVCVPPLQDDGNGACKFISTDHSCDAGGGGIPASAVSNDISGANPAARFNNTVNRKLACCLNYMNSGDPYVKFDCVENAKTKYADFNELWTSADDPTRGGQLNAMILANSNGKEMTGFYTTSGQRCAEFSEFSMTPIQPGKVDAVVQVGQMNRTGQASGFDSQGKSPLAKPTTAMFATIASKISKSVPTSTADRRRCPILVRAATLTACPANPQIPSATKRTYEDPDLVRRCAIASSVQVQVRIEQVWEIAGQPLVSPIDTVLNPMTASSISVEQAIANKYGSTCPPGTTKQGETCVY